MAVAQSDALHEVSEQHNRIIHPSQHQQAKCVAYVTDPSPRQVCHTGFEVAE